MITQKIAQDLFDYNPTIGKLIWKKAPRCNSHVLGKEAGWIRNDGYRGMRIGGKHYLAHVIVWIWNFGGIPKGKAIDHINHDELDNRLSNLRVVTQSDNCKNRKLASNNKSGHVGVYFDKNRGKWQAYANKRHIGYFETKDAAIRARKVVSGFHPNHGKKFATTEAVA